MRLVEFINEQTEDEIEKILKKVKPDFLKTVFENGFLYRGYKRQYKDIIAKTSRLEDRVPRDINIFYHNLANKYFQEKFGWKVGNGVFTNGSLSVADNYGSPYMFFPIGDYKLVWGTTFDFLWCINDIVKKFRVE